MRVADWDDMRGYCDWDAVPERVKPEPFWTDERISVLREMWEAGINTRLVAEKLGCTKNAACGKADRLYLVHGSGKTN